MMLPRPPTIGHRVPMATRIGMKLMTTVGGWARMRRQPSPMGKAYFKPSNSTSTRHHESLTLRTLLILFAPFILRTLLLVLLLIIILMAVLTITITLMGTTLLVLYP